MQYEVSRRLTTGLARPDVTERFAAQCERIASSVTHLADGRVFENVAPSFGSINCSSSIRFRLVDTDDGFLAVIQVKYLPSAVFYIFMVLGIFTLFGWALPVALYLHQQHIIRCAAEGVLDRVDNEIRPGARLRLAETPNLAEQLAQLAALHSGGALTEAEYQMAKQRVIGLP